MTEPRATTSTSSGPDDAEIWLAVGQGTHTHDAQRPSGGVEHPKAEAADDDEERHEEPVHAKDGQEVRPDTALGSPDPEEQQHQVTHLNQGGSNGEETAADNQSRQRKTASEGGHEPTFHLR